MWDSKMHTPMVCTCIKNENQANKRPSMALCGCEKKKKKQNQYTNETD